jgi:hypothetical protein
MAILHVDAVGGKGLALPGNRQNSFICVSVMDGSGTPITGLAVSSFRLDAMIVAAGGSLVIIASVRGGNVPGTYCLDLIPIATYTWKAGTYMFGLSVNQGTSHGMTVTTVTVG